MPIKAPKQYFKEQEVRLRIEVSSMLINKADYCHMETNAGFKKILQFIIDDPPNEQDFHRPCEKRSDPFVSMQESSELVTMMP